MKRLVLFSFYDPKGIVDDYVVYLLKSFNGVADEILTIVNGSLLPESVKKIEGFTKILFRENKGFDAWGYKEGLENYGYENFKKFDEIICLNHPCFGPIFPWKKMFDRMEKVECDWWSLFRDHCPQNLVPGEHMPSYFIVYRKSLFINPHFKEFWDTLPPIKNYEEDVRFYENRQTPFFDKYGFKRATAFDFSKFDDRQDNWPLTCTEEMLIKDKVPLLKRRSFFVEKGNVNALLYKNVFPFISQKTKYDLNLIVQNLKRTQDFNSIIHKSKWDIFLLKLKSKICFFTKKRVKYKRKLENQKYLVYLKNLIKEEK